MHAARLQADHLLRGYEAVALRLMQTIAARVAPDAVDRALDHALAQDGEELPETMRQLRRRFPEEPYRQRLGAIAERVRRTRAALTGETAPRTGGYADPEALDAELAVVQHALAADGLGRVAYGELADLRWQLATFGFHLASLEVRQHAAVHRAALAALDAGAGPDEAVGGGVTLGEVLATFRAMARLQARLGIRACQRYVISFTTITRRRHDRARARSARRAAGAVRALRAGPRRPARRAPVLDVVPLLESADALSGAAELLDRLLADPGVSRPPPGPRRHPGGHARLLRLEQGERVPRRELAAVPRPGGARRRRRAGTGSRSRCSTAAAARSVAVAGPPAARSSPRRRGR